MASRSNGRLVDAINFTPILKPHFVPCPEYRKLNVFIGKWYATGKVAVTGPQQALKVNLVDSYRWYPGEFFLVHEAEGTVGEEFSNNIEIIGLPESNVICGLKKLSTGIKMELVV